MQFSLQLLSEHWRKKSIASCSKHVTGCNLGLRLVMVSKKQLVFHDALFLEFVSQRWKKTIYCKLQQICCSLQYQTATCSSFKSLVQTLQKMVRLLLCAIVASRRRLLRGHLTQLQPTGNLSCSAMNTQVPRKIGSCNTGLKQCHTERSSPTICHDTMLPRHDVATKVSVM